MNEINDGGINAQLVRRFNIVDTAVPAGSLAPEVFPVVQVTPPSSEDAYLRNEFLCAGGAVQAAAVGQYPLFRLLNVSGSSLLAMVDAIVFFAASGGVGVLAGLTNGGALLANVHPTGVRDSRILPTTTSRQTHCTLSSETSIAVPFAAFGKKMFSSVSIATQYLYLPLPVVLRPGCSLDVGIDSTNITVACSFLWRERRVQPSELG